MRGAWISILLAALLGCSKAEPYRTGKLSMLSAFSAKEMCTCLFVVERSETFCREYVKQWPPVTWVSVNHGAKTVSARALLFYASRARWVSRDYGCILEDG